MKRNLYSRSAKLLESARIGSGRDWKAREVSVEESPLRSFNARPWRPMTRGAADADADSLTPARIVEDADGRLRLRLRLGDAGGWVGRPGPLDGRRPHHQVSPVSYRPMGVLLGGWGVVWLIWEG